MALRVILLSLLLTLLRAERPADYIVVGSGPGGCAVAARLCARLPGRRVMLLERGPAPKTASEELLLRAARNTFAALRSRFVERLETAPNAGLGGRAETVVSGNALGGLSVANTGQWTRATPADAAQWGFRGLSPARAERLFKRAEAAVRPSAPPPALRQALAAEWLSAAGKAGIAGLCRPGGSDDCAGDNVLAVDAAGRRRDACSAYLEPVRDGACRRNLQVLQGAHVLKLLLSGRRAGKAARRGCKARGRGMRRRATGVEYTLGAKGVPQRLRARRGVILAAGAVGSPLVLLRSGVGPAAVLRAAGVPVKETLPVGQGVSSRVIATLVSAYTGIPTVDDNLTEKVRAPAARAQFLRGDGGPLGRAIASVNARLGGEFLLLATAAFDLADPAGADQPLLLTGCLGNPAPSGSITIGSADPAAKPTLGLDYLGGPGEAARLAGCLRKLREVHRNLPPFLKAVEVRPGASVQDITADTIRENARTAYHIVGGCAVKKVVDGQFRVKGIDGVRVVDASVIPKMPRQAGPLASIYMLAEHASDMIVEDDKEGC